MAYFFGKVFRAFLVIYVGVFSFLLVRPAPIELDESPVAIPINAQMVSFLADTTYQGESGAVRVEENIFPRILEVLKGAHSFIYADMFLFNEFHGKDSTVFRDQTNVLRNALVGKKSMSSSTQVIFLTDPINRGYGGVIFLYTSFYCQYFVGIKKCLFVIFCIFIPNITSYTKVY
jgi:hypothetical protein